MCGKVLSCGNPDHICKSVCHDGDCTNCDLEEVQICFCGNESSSQLCGSGTLRISDGKRHYSCQKICNKLLSCNNHHCSKPCHSGPCIKCFREIRKIDYDDENDNEFHQNCACGANILIVEAPRIKCTDPLPTCSNICGIFFVFVLYLVKIEF